MKALIVALSVLFFCSWTHASEPLANRDFHIVVSASQNQIWVLQDGKKIGKFPIAGPKSSSDFYRFLRTNKLVQAKILAIQIRPFWFPPPSLQEEYGTVVKPGDPRNAMGAAKIILAVKNYPDPNIRIHGTNKPWEIGQNASRGCIRMNDKDILRLINLIGGTKKGRQAQVVLKF